MLSPIRIPLIPRKTPSSLESDLTSLYLRSRKQTPNSAYRSKNTRVFRALSEIKREESPEDNIATLDKEIEAMIEETEQTKERKSSEKKSRGSSYSREKRRITSRSAEGAGSSDYAHSGVYSLQEA